MYLKDKKNPKSTEIKNTLQKLAHNRQLPNWPIVTAHTKVKLRYYCQQTLPNCLIKKEAGTTPLAKELFTVAVTTGLIIGGGKHPYKDVLE